jgi:hypothetical protein
VTQKGTFLRKGFARIAGLPCPIQLNGRTLMRMSLVPVGDRDDDEVGDGDDD